MNGLKSLNQQLNHTSMDTGSILTLIFLAASQAFLCDFDFSCLYIVSDLYVMQPLMNVVFIFSVGFASAKFTHTKKIKRQQKFGIQCLASMCNLKQNTGNERYLCNFFCMRG